MKFWDVLTGKNNTTDYTKNMPPLAPQLDNIRINDDGTATNVPTADEKALTAFDKLSNRTKKIGNNLFNNLFGNQAQPTDFVNTNTMSAGISSSPRVGGLFNDIASGARENFVTGFAAPNLYSKQTPDGRNKGFAYRLGEGLGTIGRFAESPLGRSLITAGLVGATGGDSLDALAYGGQAGALNQRLRNQDRIYRNSMIENAQSSLRNNPEFNKLSAGEQNAIYNQLLTNSDGTMKNYDTMNDKEKAEFNVALNKAYADKLYQNQQEQLNNAANQINSMRGYITPDVYGNMLHSQQLQDNAAYRKMYYDNQLQNQKEMQQLRKDQLAMQKQQNAIDNYYRGQSNALDWAKLAADRNKPNVNFNGITSLRKEFTSLPPVKNSTEITRQYNNVYSLYNQYKSGKIGKNAFDQALITTLNKVLDPTSVVRESEFDRTAAGQAVWDKLNGYQQKLTRGGSGLTDANRDDLVNALTIMKQANDNEVKEIVNDYADLAQRYGINPADIMPRHYKNGSAKQAGSFKEGQTAVNKKTGERIIWRNGKWEPL